MFKILTIIGLVYMLYRISFHSKKIEQPFQKKQVEDPDDFTEYEEIE